MATRRTQRQIELDCKIIQEAAKTATTMKEIAEIAGLTQSEIRTSLSKHPRISKKVQKQVEDNKAAAEKAAVEKEKALPKVEVPKTNEPVTSQVNNDSDFEMGFVIDTSMVGVEAIYEMLRQICETDAKVILTSVVRQELNTMQSFKKDEIARQARGIMALAAQRPEKFYNVLIDETLETHDDCIVKYCVDNRHRVILLTADKNMALDAREQLVKVEFFRRGFRQIRSINDTMVPKKGKADIRTLNPARRIGNKLIIMDMQGEKRDIRVLSNGKEYVDGIVELSVGDEVLIVGKKSNCITFGHYNMITLYEEDNCKLVYARKIYSYDEIENLPRADYKAFAKDFWNKHGLKK